MTTRSPAINPARLFNPLTGGLLLAALTLAVFWPITRHPFLPWDDAFYITNHPLVRNGFAPWWETLSSIHHGNWHPLTTLSHQLDVALFGLNAPRHHAVSLAWHIATSLLLVPALRRAGLSPLWAFLGGLIFALHPLHVESVAWASARKDVLSGFFSVASLYFYLHPTDLPAGRRRAFWLAVVCGLLAMMAKPTAMTLPLVLALFGLNSGRAEEKSTFIASLRELLQRSAKLLPLWLGAFFLIWLTWQAQQKSGTVTGLEELGATDRLALAINAYGHYLQQFFVPGQLSYLHELERPIATWRSPLIALLFGGITLLLVRGYGLKSPAFLGWLVFLVTIAPVSGLVHIGAHAYADRYMYVSIIGLIWAVLSIGQRHLGARHGRLVAAASLVFLALMAVISHRYVVDWGSMQTLNQRARTLQPGHCTARLGMAYHAIAQQQWTAAENDLRFVEQSCPRYYDQERVTLALARLAEGQRRVDEAMSILLRGRERMPDSTLIRVQLAQMYLDQRHAEKAVELLSVPDATGTSEAYRQHWFGQALLQAPGQEQTAISYFRQWVGREPRNAGVWYYLGMALVRTDDQGAAIQATQQSLMLEPDSVAANIQLANLYLSSGQYSSAQRTLEHLRRLAPDNPEIKVLQEKLPAAK